MTKSPSSKADEERVEGQRLIGGVAQHALELEEPAFRHPGDNVDLLVLVLTARGQTGRGLETGPPIG
jgi:hypothetical protein